MSSARAQAPLPGALEVYAAGSLREAFTEIAAAYRARGGTELALTLGASGLLRERIESRGRAHVFVSADMGHPQCLAQGGDWTPPVVFARSELCALTQPAITTTPAELLDTMLRRDVRLGTSTPGADPSGDYAWEVFRKAEALHPGAYVALSAKALKLTGASHSPKPPPGHSTYAWVMEQGQADVFLTYCTNAIAVLRAVPRMKIVSLPPAMQVGAAYGLTVRNSAPPGARQFADYLLSAEAQAVLQRFGFGRP